MAVPSRQYAKTRETGYPGGRPLAEECVHDGPSVDGVGTWVLTIQGGSYGGYIPWNPNQTLTFSAPPSWGMTQECLLTGDTVSIPESTVQVGPEPILLH